MTRQGSPASSVLRGSALLRETGISDLPLPPFLFVVLGVDGFPGPVSELDEAFRRNSGFRHHRALPVHGVGVEILGQVAFGQRHFVELAPWEGDGDEERDVGSAAVDQSLGQLDALEHFLLGFIREADHHVDRAGDADLHGSSNQLQNIEPAQVEFARGVLVQNALASGLHGEDDLVEPGALHHLQVFTVRFEAPTGAAPDSEVDEVDPVHVADLHSESGEPAEEIGHPGFLGQETVVFQIQVRDAERTQGLDFFHHPVDRLQPESADVSRDGTGLLFPADVAVGAAERATPGSHERRVAASPVGDDAAVRRVDLVVLVEGQQIPCRQRKMIEIGVNVFRRGRLGLDEPLVTEDDAVQLAEAAARLPGVDDFHDYLFRFGGGDQVHQAPVQELFWNRPGVDAACDHQRIRFHLLRDYSHLQGHSRLRGEIAADADYVVLTLAEELLEALGSHPDPREPIRLEHTSEERSPETVSSRSDRRVQDLCLDASSAQSASQIERSERTVWAGNFHRHELVGWVHEQHLGALFRHVASPVCANTAFSAALGKGVLFLSLSSEEWQFSRLIVRERDREVERDGQPPHGCDGDRRAAVEPIHHY